MAFHTWQIGLDIQNRQFCALAIQRRRDGWHLCHWWQQRLPQDTLRNGVLQSSPELQSALTDWRKRLPQRYSLRVGLPNQLVLQRALPLPAQALKEPALGRYVQAAAQRLFPVEPEALALDYRPDISKGQLCVSAARLEIIEQWRSPLRQAGLAPEVFELTTHALVLVVQAARFKAGSVLLLRQESNWLWSDGTTGGDADGAATFEHVCQQAFPQAAEVHYCSVQDASVPVTLRPFSPFDLFRNQHPPVPENPGAFTLAAGLALREKDSP